MKCLLKQVESLKTGRDFQNNWFEETKKDLDEMRAKDLIEKDIKLIDLKDLQLEEKSSDFED